MAGHLWEMTGIEPYCIWQTYHSPEDYEARQLADLLDLASEPVMLIPVPSNLSDPQFRFPQGAVDAVVVHHSASEGPASGLTASKRVGSALPVFGMTQNGLYWLVLS